MLTDQDVERLRAETPAAAATIFFNPAGAALTPAGVTAAMIDHLRAEASLGPHEAAALAADRLAAAREGAAALLGAAQDEIAILASGSAAWGPAFAALPPFRHGDRILVGRQEWGGNLSTMEAAARRAGATVEVIPCQTDGAVDPVALDAMIDDRARLIALTWCPANGGLINDAAAVGRVARRHGVAYFLDAA